MGQPNTAMLYSVYGRFLLLCVGTCTAKMLLVQTKGTNNITHNQTTSTNKTSGGSDYHHGWGWGCLRAGLDYYGHDIKTIHTQTAMACACACSRQPGCYFFTYDPPFTACNMKNSDRGRTHKKTTVSGGPHCCGGWHWWG